MKPENLLLAKEGSKLILKIADFGLARVLDGPEMAQTLCGTRHYMAPEIQKGSQYTDKVDLWSAGVIMYRALTGKRLFQKMPELHQLNNPNFRLFNPNSQEVNHLTPHCKDLLSRLLKDNPEERIDWDSFINHPFLKEEIKKSLFWEQYDSKDIQYVSKNTVETNPKQHTVKIEEKQKLVNGIKKLADDFYNKGKNKESFVLYVELLSMTKSLIDSSESIDSEQLLYDELKAKALKIRSTLKTNDSVKNPIRMILDHVIERGISGADFEKKQDWSAATDQYFNGLSCLYFLENYCSKHGTVMSQNEVFKYMDLFKQRHAYSKDKRDKMTTL